MNNRWITVKNVFASVANIVHCAMLNLPLNNPEVHITRWKCGQEWLSCDETSGSNTITKDTEIHKKRRLQWIWNCEQNGQLSTWNIIFELVWDPHESVRRWTMASPIATLVEETEVWKEPTSTPVAQRTWTSCEFCFWSQSHYVQCALCNDVHIYMS